MKRLKQVVFNLIGNSIKFCNFGGFIELIYIYVTENLIKITVKDNGCGILK